MNIDGYYDSAEIWLPDPILKQIHVQQTINQFDSSKKKRDLERQTTETEGVAKKTRGTHRHQKRTLKSTKDLNISYADFEAGRLDPESTNPSDSFLKHEDSSFTEVDEEEQIWNNNGGLNSILNTGSERIQKIINVSKKGMDDIFLFDLFVALEIKADRPPFLIAITRKKDIQGLQQQILDDCEQLYDEFKGLKGLRVKDMKIQQPVLAALAAPPGTVGINKLGDSVLGAINQMQAKRVNFESYDELARNHFRPRDHVYVDLESADLWLSAVIRMDAPPNKVFEATFDMKIEFSMSGKQLKKALQKLSLSFWNRLCHEQQASEDAEDPEHVDSHKSLYVLTSIDAYRFEEIVDKTRSSNSSSRGIESSFSPSSASLPLKMEAKGSTRYPNLLRFAKTEVDDTLKVKDMFSFKNNRLHVNCRFETITTLFEAMKPELVENPELVRSLLEDISPNSVPGYEVSVHNQQIEHAAHMPIVDAFMDQQVDRTIDFTKLAKNERKLPFPSFLKASVLDRAQMPSTPKKSKFSIFGGKPKHDEADREGSLNVPKDSLMVNHNPTVFVKNSKSKFFSSSEVPMIDTEAVSERDSIVMPVLTQSNQEPDEDDSPSRRDLMNIVERRHNIIDGKVTKKLCNVIFQFLILPSKQEVAQQSIKKRKPSKHKLVLDENYVPNSRAPSARGDNSANLLSQQTLSPNTTEMAREEEKEIFGGRFGGAEYVDTEGDQSPLILSKSPKNLTVQESLESSDSDIEMVKGEEDTSRNLSTMLLEQKPPSDPHLRLKRKSNQSQLDTWFQKMPSDTDFDAIMVDKRGEDTSYNRAVSSTESGKPVAIEDHTLLRLSKVSSDGHMKRSTMKFPNKSSLVDHPQKGRKQSTNIRNLEAPLIEGSEEQNGPQGKLSSMINGFMKKINPVKKKDNLQLDLEDTMSSKKEPHSAKAKKSFEFPSSTEAEAKGTLNERTLGNVEGSSDQGDFTMRINFLKSKISSGNHQPSSLPSTEKRNSYAHAPSVVQHKPSQNFFVSGDVMDKLDSLTEEVMMKAIKLPQFLITKEEFDSFIDPPLRHLNYNQIKDQAGTSILDTLLNEKKMKNVVARSGRKARRFTQQCCAGKEMVAWFLALVGFLFFAYLILFHWEVKIVSQY